MPEEKGGKRVLIRGQFCFRKSYCSFILQLALIDSLFHFIPSPDIRHSEMS